MPRNTIAAFSVSIFVALAHGHAHATDLPVNYWVDAADLKADAPAGTMLTFELHSDALCSAPYFSDTFDINDIYFSIEKLKLAAVSDGTKPPKPARINAVLESVPPAAATYLRVTGAGITPIGGACQAQVAGVEGPAGADGADGIQGPQGPSGVVATASFNGALPASIAGLSSSYIFAGATANVSITATQRLTGAASAALGASSAGPLGVDLGLCYRLGMGAVTNFAGGNYQSVEVGNGPRHTYAASATVVPGSAGTYTVGFCVRNNSSSALDDNDYVNGWVMVTN